MVEIFDDFLSQDAFDEMSEFFTGFEKMPRATYFVSEIDSPDVYKGKHPLRFANTLYGSYRPTHDDVGMIAPLMNKISPRAVMRVKINFDLCTPYPDSSGMHVDFTGVSLDGLKTGLFYLNTNNGKTRLEDGTEIESVANRFVYFPASTMHEGISCTDQPFRCVLNINFF